MKSGQCPSSLFIVGVIDMSQILIIDHFEHFHETRYNQGIAGLIF